MNLATIEGRVYERMGYAAAPATEVVTRVRNAINSTYLEIMGKKGYDVLRQGLVTFSSIANVEYAVLPQAVSVVYSIADRVRNWLLDDIATSTIRYNDPGLLSSAAYPWAYSAYNLASAVLRQPSNASELFVKSTNAGDGATKTAYFQGIAATGALRSVSVALNGTTAVSLGATLTDWVRVDKFWLALTSGGGATTATGTVSLYEDSGSGTVLSDITPGRSFARYSMIHLYPTPTAVNTYTADAMVRLVDLANGGDEALLPEDYHWLLESGGIMKEWQRREKHSSYAEEYARYKQGLAELTVYVNRFVPPTQQTMRRFSQLGPYYQAGS